MPDSEIKKIAENSDLIVDGYAFSRCDIGFRVLNLNNPERASVVDINGDILETNMDDIEARIVSDYLIKSLVFLEAQNA